MSNYTPGTLDNEAVQKRRIKKMKRLSREANMPTGSQVFATTDKVANGDGSVDELKRRFDSFKSDTESKLETLTERLDGLNVEAKFNEIDSSLEAMSLVILGHDDQIEANSESITSLESKIDDIEEKLNSYDDALLSINQAIEAINEKLDRMAGNDNAL